MAINQPVHSGNHPREAWEYEITAQLNNLEGRSLALLNTVDTKARLTVLQNLLKDYKEIKERNNTALLFIQDEQPSPVHNSEGFLWIQTNVNDEGDFTFWFCSE